MSNNTGKFIRKFHDISTGLLFHIPEDKPAEKLISSREINLLLIDNEIEETERTTQSVLYKFKNKN